MKSLITAFLLIVGNFYHAQSSFLFLKTIALSELDYSQFFMPIRTFHGIDTLSICSAMVLLHAKSDRTSGFVYYDDICIIGRVHPFSDPFSPTRKILDKYTDGVHVYDGSGCFANMSILPNDLYGLFIFGEDLFFSVPRYNFRQVSGVTDFTKMSFTVPNKVPKFSGYYGAKFDNTPATGLRFFMPTPLVGMQSFTVLAWVYPQDPIGWNNMLWLGRTDSLGNPDWYSGFDFGFDGALTMKMTTNPLAVFDSFAFHTTPIQNNWQYFAFRYSYVDGAIAFFRNGVQVPLSAGTPTPGQKTFHDLNMALIGRSSRGHSYQVMGSVELYLKPLTGAELNISMVNSQSYGSFHSCNIFQ